jgi:hypothetical protein
MRHGTPVSYRKRCGVTGEYLKQESGDLAFERGTFIEHPDSNKQFCRILNDSGKIEIATTKDTRALK